MSAWHGCASAPAPPRPRPAPPTRARAVNYKKNPANNSAICFIYLWLQGANTAITEPNTNNIVFGYAMFYGGLAQFVSVPELTLFLA